MTTSWTATTRLFAFVISLLALCWYGMMAVHELGHVLGAWWTHGTVLEVVLHPLRISQTHVFPNPRPSIVVWMGPLFGCLFPSTIALLVPRRFIQLRTVGLFFAGFCCIANGAYIAGGATSGIGDCGEMIKTGTPVLAMYLFGAVGVFFGMTMWHRLGSPSELIVHPEVLSPRIAYGTISAFVCIMALWIVALETVR